MYNEMKPVPSYKGDHGKRAKTEDTEVERIKALLFEGRDEEKQEDPTDKLKELFQPEQPKNTLKDWIKKRKENQLPW